ncbi:MAG: hypothetical protein NTW86_27150 [Candidatus Sumerlaeota bacterium]|nr:hypothetical protein [Candidatus Sumerlaeota bacterium]
MKTDSRLLALYLSLALFGATLPWAAVPPKSPGPPHVKNPPPTVHTPVLPHAAPAHLRLRRRLAFLPTNRPVAPVVVPTKPRTVVYDGRPLVVYDPPETVIQDPSLDVLALPAFATPASSSATGAEPESAATAAEPAADGPLVEFARLADQRVHELQAYEGAAQASKQGLVKAADGKWYKAYNRYTVQSISIRVDSANPVKLAGEIRYNATVYIQSGDSQANAVASAGKPDPDEKPIEALERYAYEDGAWSYVAQ